VSRRISMVGRHPGFRGSWYALRTGFRTLPGVPAGTRLLVACPHFTGCEGIPVFPQSAAARSVVGEVRQMLQKLQGPGRVVRPRRYVVQEHFVFTLAQNLESVAALKDRTGGIARIDGTCERILGGHRNHHHQQGEQNSHSRLPRQLYHEF